MLGKKKGGFIVTGVFQNQTSAVIMCASLNKIIVLLLQIEEGIFHHLTWVSLENLFEAT